MSVFPYISSTGTDRYRSTVLTPADAALMLNQFEQAESIVTSGIESIVAGTNITVDNTDPLNPIVSVTSGGSGTVESVVAGTGITVDDTDPANPIVSVTGGVTGVVETIVAGTNVTVDDTDPANPIISVSGLVESVVAGSNITVDNTDPLNPIINGENGGVQSVTAGTNVSVDNTDPANPIVSTTGFVQSIVAGDNITVDNTDPANPIVTGENGGVQSVTAGTDISVDNTDPANPIVSATGATATNSQFYARCATRSYSAGETIAFGTVFFDDDSYVNAGTGVITFPEAGTYFISANFTISSVSGSDRGFTCVSSIATLDGGIAIPTSDVQFLNNSGIDQGCVSFALQTLAPGETLYFTTLQNGTVNSTLTALSDSFTASWVCGARVF